MWTAAWSLWGPLLFSLASGERPRSSHRPVFACGGNFTGRSGFIGSQGHPAVYPPNTKCVWRITVPQGRVVSLSFRVMDLESDNLCKYDYVDIYDGHVSGQRLGRFCGTSRPGALVTSGNKMQVVMVSDANTAGSGFLAAYAAIWPNEGGNRYCGGFLNKPGTLKTPNWPDRDYPAGVTCSWHIMAPQHQIIELKFEKFDLERDNHCRYDHMAVYNGGEASDVQRIGRFCGDSPPAPIYSDDSQLFIQFVSDLSLTADGFIGHYLFKPKNSTITGSPLTSAPTTPTTARPTALTYSEALCKQKCTRSGTIESHYCSSNFVITGTLISATMREHTVLATFSIINVYKEGNLAIQQAGKTMSTRITVLCKKCPLVRRGLNYIVMGHIDEQGQGIVSPHNFVMAFKIKKQRDLAVLTNVHC
ncbi:procollagen C-endopeptidase enhancer 2 isoform X1 [Pygocentrus nattereri]|uniref:Procollagen C-endopeptidase enhancer 2b n=1 Tax=Pygocentrus nattereri TaxID=42514 RepID=A0A3B4E449_PYGNA|nr:procollagen C-endopeptidase enhancer 2 isoform X1 [Pygocentrus nattereri]